MSLQRPQHAHLGDKLAHDSDDVGCPFNPHQAQNMLGLPRLQRRAQGGNAVFDFFAVHIVRVVAALAVGFRLTRLRAHVRSNCADPLLLRVKHLATLVLTTTFAISAAFSVVFIPPIILTGQSNQEPYFIPRGPIAAFCLVIILIPHRWLALLLLPRRLRCYDRLAALEHYIETLVPIRREAFVWSHVLDPEEMEMAIYVTVINILDRCRRVDLGDPCGCELVAQIGALLPECADYDQLVGGIMPHRAVTDPVPHNGNRLGYWLGIIFHPFSVFIPAPAVVLKGYRTPGSGRVGGVSCGDHPGSGIHPDSPGPA